MIFVATKKGRTTNFFSSLSFVAVFGFGIRDGQKSGSGIRDKHPGSTTLSVSGLMRGLFIRFYLSLSARYQTCWRRWKGHFLTVSFGISIKKCTFFYRIRVEPNQCGSGSEELRNSVLSKSILKNVLSRFPAMSISARRCGTRWRWSRRTAVRPPSPTPTSVTWPWGWVRRRVPAPP